MNKFSAKQFVPTVTNTSNTGSFVDWAVVNDYVAKTVQEAVHCEEGSPSSCVGIISGIVDYGCHQDEERVEPMDSGDQDVKDWRVRMVNQNRATVDDEGMFHYQAPPAQEVGFFVDFPGVIVDKGQFFGTSNPAPYRVLLGGVFKGQPSSPTKVNGYLNDNQEWCFGNKNKASMLARATKLKGIKDGFAQHRLLELIGRPLQLNVEVYVSEAGFLQERITNPSPLMEGIPIPEYDDSLLFYVSMKEENDAQSLKFLTRPCKEYCQSALDYDDSVLRKQLLELEDTAGKMAANELKAALTKSTSESTESQGSDTGSDDDEYPF